MLSKKQYLYTLIIAIVIFFAFFVMTYFYTKEHSWVKPSETQEIERQARGLSIEAPIGEKVTILPQTQITLKTHDTTTHKREQTKLDANTLLGLTEEALQEQFKDYTIEVFDEKEVTLVKHFSSDTSSVIDTATYVLGVEGNYVCIKEKNTMKRPVKIDYEINHFSKYIYSLLLNEEIVITSAQKEALLLNPSTLQKILQGYTGE